MPELVRLLGEQQPSSGYPVRWPLPFPVEEFLVRDDEERAWVAEVDGRVVGHAAVGQVRDLGVREVLRGATGGVGVAAISVLFVAVDLVGRGVGGRLLDEAVAFIRGTGRLPVLDVVRTHGTAVEVYRHRGWQVVGEARPAWLPADREPVLLMALPESVGSPIGSPDEVSVEVPVEVSVEVSVERQEHHVQADVALGG
ncbi:GNAT family N-acetyltransferase [Nocardioides sp. MJB4]|uniref:GNAT family N-acetyltransferase n=1 Tax=Nocardioides donggukensis TaxID=2774019 RepID=A0A927K9W5_9ACTN|nr:GNAT family N-acetyltransferase [Nocardioides donggukensis]